MDRTRRKSSLQSFEPYRTLQSIRNSTEIGRISSVDFPIADRGISPNKTYCLILCTRGKTSGRQEGAQRHVHKISLQKPQGINSAWQCMAVFLRFGAESCISVKIE
jgi:hypothetical protein